MSRIHEPFLCQLISQEISVPQLGGEGEYNWLEFLATRAGETYFVQCTFPSEETQLQGTRLLQQIATVTKQSQ